MRAASQNSAVLLLVLSAIMMPFELDSPSLGAKDLLKERSIRSKHTRDSCMDVRVSPSFVRNSFTSHEDLESFTTKSHEPIIHCR
jgi:hypothetical protein